MGLLPAKRRRWREVGDDPVRPSRMDFAHILGDRLAAVYGLGDLFDWGLESSKGPPTCGFIDLKSPRAGVNACLLDTTPEQLLHCLLTHEWAHGKDSGTP